MRLRILSVMPLISLLLFLVSWLYFDKIELGLTFFLLIPLASMLLTNHFWKRLSEIMPFLCLVIFLWLGYGLDLWHPGWLIFFLVPLTNIIVERKLTPRKLVGIAISAIYITLGILYNIWHPGWIMFLLIPIINTLFFPQKNAYFDTSKNYARYRKIIDDDEN